MEKIFNQKNFSNFIRSPLDSRGNIYINFCLQVHFQVSAAWYCSNYLPPVSITPVANLPPVSLIPVAICCRCRWHRWCTLTCEYLREFSKKFEMILMLLSGAWGKVIHEKNLKQKISWHCPFNKLLRLWHFVSVLNLKFLDQLERRHCKDTPYFRPFYIGATNRPFLWGLNSVWGTIRRIF